jgi:hypothetical protein
LWHGYFSNHVRIIWFFFCFNNVQSVPHELWNIIGFCGYLSWVNPMTETASYHPTHHKHAYVIACIFAEYACQISCHLDENWKSYQCQKIAAMSQNLEILFLRKCVSLQLFSVLEKLIVFQYILTAVQCLRLFMIIFRGVYCKKTFWYMYLENEILFFTFEQMFLKLY